MISQRIIKKLIKMGNDAEIDSPAITQKYESLRRYRHINGELWDTWEAVAEKLLIEDLIALLKGLTVAEVVFRWNFGSTAAATRVYQALQRRDETKSEELRKWMTLRTDNTYLGGSGSNDHRRKLSVMHPEVPVDPERVYPKQGERKLSPDEVMYKERQENQDREDREKKLRKQRRLEMKPERVKFWATKNRQRADLLKAAEDLSAMDKLQLVISNDKWPIDFFPEEWANVSESVLTAMDDAARGSLYSRIRNKKKGVWKKLAVRLAALS